MKLKVNPNRMELLRLRKRLVLAERGHKLLKDKLEEIMRRFLEIMRELYDIQGRLGKKLDKVFLSFAIVRANHSGKELDELIFEGNLQIETKKEKVFNLSIPNFDVKKLEVAEYDLLNTESELDVGIKNMREGLDDLLEMGRLWKAIELLSQEIESTRRRVNALQHIIIPNIKETIHYISSRLDEMERSTQVQLLRVKEIVRGH